MSHGQLLSDLGRVESTNSDMVGVISDSDHPTCRLRNHVPVRTQRKMACHEKWRAIYRAWRYRWRIERLEIDFLCHCIRPGHTVVDVGAHKGAFTYWMQRTVGASGHVFSFEPQPELANYLDRMRDALDLQRVTVVNTALSSATGRMKLVRPDGMPCPGASLTRSRQEDKQFIFVSVDTLDNYFSDHCQRPVNFIKCDVEGHEYDVFRGGQKILMDDRPVLLFECERRHQEHGCIDHVFIFLEKLGYQGYFFSKSSSAIRPLSELNENHLANSESGNYVRNFAFLPKSNRSSVLSL